MLSTVNHPEPTITPDTTPFKPRYLKIPPKTTRPKVIPSTIYNISTKTPKYNIQSFYKPSPNTPSFSPTQNPPHRP